MAQVVSCWPLTVDALVQPQASQHAIRGEIGTGTGFSLGTYSPSLSVPQCSTHILSVTDAIILVTECIIK